MNHLIAVDDGIASGNLNAADICFLVALIVFGVVAIWRFTRDDVIGVLVSVAAALVALGLLLL